MYTPLQVLILNGIVSGNGKVNPGHECVDQPADPPIACILNFSLSLIFGAR
jgi:hypothetical protein